MLVTNVMCQHWLVTCLFCHWSFILSWMCQQIIDVNSKVIASDSFLFILIWYWKIYNLLNIWWLFNVLFAELSSGQCVFSIPNNVHHCVLLKNQIFVDAVLILLHCFVAKISFFSFRPYSFINGKNNWTLSFEKFLGGWKKRLDLWYLSSF